MRRVALMELRMALELMDEHEKGEHVRAWLRQNGSAIVTGVALGLFGIFGWQWYQRSQVEHRVTAATQYDALTEAVERKETDTVAALADELAKNYGDTPYAALAAMQLADARLAAGDATAASEALARVPTLTEDEALTGLASLRLARLALTGGDAEGALKHAEAVPAKMFEGLVAEIRGDALRTLGRSDEARSAYEAALVALDTGAPNRRIVELKLADAGGSTTTPEA
jgi:predicted negative regulator of RcsB-dependent stress response